MFLGLGTRDRNVSCESCWGELEKGFKFFFLSCLVLAAVSMLPFLEVLPSLLYCSFGKVVLGLQVWRLFVSFWFNGAGLQGLIMVLINCYILYSCMPDVEKRLSTAYVLLDLFLQTLLNNLLLLALTLPAVYLLGLSPDHFVGFTLLPLLFNYLWVKASVSPDEPSRFCCCPCLIPARNIPWCFLLLLVVFGWPPVICIVSCLCGYLQHIHLGRNVFRLPLKVYRRFDSLVPASLANSPGYIKVSSVEAELKTVCSDSCCACLSCCCTCCDRTRAEDEGQGNPFNANRAVDDRVEVLGGGVSIGSSSHQQPQNSNFRSHWQKKEEERQQAEVRAQAERRGDLEEAEGEGEGELERRSDLEQADRKSLERSVVSDMPLVEEADIDDEPPRK